MVLVTAEISLPDTPQNAALLEFLRAQSSPTKNLDYGGFELHTHPDLIQRLAAVLPPRWPVIPVYGAAVVASGGIAAVFALGMDSLYFRLPSVPGDLEPGGSLPPLTDLDWRSLDAWQSELVTAEGIRKLSGVTRGALQYVRSLSD